MDLEDAASEIENIHFLLNDGTVMNNRHKAVMKVIQQYAESYHSKKCVHCQKIVYCELCGDPISVGVCENCVPEVITKKGSNV